MRVGTFLKDRKLIFVESKIYKRLVLFVRYVPWNEERMWWILT